MGQTWKRWRPDVQSTLWRYRWDLNSYVNGTEDRPSGEIPGLTPKLGAVASTVTRLETGTPLLLGYRNAYGGARDG